MVGLKDELLGDISRIVHQNLVVRDGLNIPTNLALIPEGGLRYDCTVLVADFAHFANQASDFEQNAAAKVTRAFLRSTCRLITANGGTVINFNGQKVTGIFLGDMRNTNAAICALKINYTTIKMIEPSLQEYFTAAKTPGFSISHCVGVDTGSMVALRAGLIGLNDLVWVGKAANLSAELSQIRAKPYYSYITESVFFMLFEQAKFSPRNRSELMWEESAFNYQGETIKVYRSTLLYEP